MSSSLLDRVVAWYLTSSSASNNAPEICGTRDVFQARLDTLYREIGAYAGFPEDETTLLVAVAGEIGNNCFDHNIGQWQDVIGCWFGWSFENGISVTIADRGQGVLKSLSRVQPSLQTEEEALKTAFEKKLSGRSPEQRGNGLKFVRSVIHQHKNRRLLFFSGNCLASFGEPLEKKESADKIRKKNGTGTLAYVLWGKE